MTTNPAVVPDSQQCTPDNEFIYGPYVVLSDQSTYDSALEHCCVAYVSPKGQTNLEECNDFNAVEGDEFVYLTLRDLLDAYNSVHGTSL